VLHVMASMAGEHMHIANLFLGNLIAVVTLKVFQV
jgi:hypothetical protein